MRLYGEARVRLLLRKYALRIHPWCTAGETGAFTSAIGIRKGHGFPSDKQVRFSGTTECTSCLQRTSVRCGALWLHELRRRRPQTEAELPQDAFANLAMVGTFP